MRQRLQSFRELSRGRHSPHTHVRNVQAMQPCAHATPLRVSQTVLVAVAEREDRICLQRLQQHLAKRRTAILHLGEPSLPRAEAGGGGRHRRCVCCVGARSARALASTRSAIVVAVVRPVAMSNEAAAVLPTIYRSLLRLGRQLDKNPLSKALLIAQPAHLFDRRSRAVIKLPSLSGWSSALESFNGGEFYSPESSAQQAVRGAFTNPPPGDPLDVGFTALRSLGLAAMGGEALEREHAFDGGGAVERLSAVRATSTVKAGSLLLTHPVSCLKQPTLHHAVILIIAADDDSVSGLVINKPLDVTLSAAISDKVKISVGETLSSYPLYKGGDVSERQLLLLHDIEGLSESTPVVDGLYATSSFQRCVTPWKSTTRRRRRQRRRLRWVTMRLEASADVHRRVSSASLDLRGGQRRSFRPSYKGMFGSLWRRRMRRRWR